ncbi:hypothetical protein BHM03_00042714 [Ensete ventricosum]|uniref:Uncharacterized protein n=1 Tax=Ensete ventricosum TaxID=4639 RepID=A0A445MKV9_ENSVE|nr:hypothetical protein BHM03_00042714 [Ensete ventricosum]
MGWQLAGVARLLARVATYGQAPCKGDQLRQGPPTGIAPRAGYLRPRPPTPVAVQSDGWLGCLQGWPPTAKPPARATNCGKGRLRASPRGQAAYDQGRQRRRCLRAQR